MIYECMYSLRETNEHTKHWTQTVTISIHKHNESSLWFQICNYVEGYPRTASVNRLCCKIHKYHTYASIAVTMSPFHVFASSTRQETICVALWVCSPKKRRNTCTLHSHSASPSSRCYVPQERVKNVYIHAQASRFNQWVDIERTFELELQN